MRILQISSAKNFGGGEKHFVDLCSGLYKNGQEVFVALRTENNWAEKLDFLPSENIFNFPLKNSLDIFSAGKIAKVMREKKIEIAHAHLARDYPIASLAVRLFPKAKLVLTRHVLFPMKSLHKLTLSNVSKVIAVSSAVETNLQKIFPKEKIERIPNGIATENFTNINQSELRQEFRLMHNISFDENLIGAVGELKKLKGQEDFILAANEIIKKFPKTHFLIVGTDNSFDQSFRRQLKRLVKVFDLEEKFTFLDWLEDLTPVLAAIDIFVSPSHTESFGLAILEAMACGNVVVATETEGAKELIKADFSGKLTLIENPVELAKAVCEILEDEEKRIELANNAQKFAIENFSLEKMVEATEKVYHHLK